MVGKDIKFVVKIFTVYLGDCLGSYRVKKLFVIIQKRPVNRILKDGIPE